MTTIDIVLAVLSGGVILSSYAYLARRTFESFARVPLPPMPDELPKHRPGLCPMHAGSPSTVELPAPLPVEAERPVFGGYRKNHRRAVLEAYSAEELREAAEERERQEGPS